MGWKGQWHNTGAETINSDLGWILASGKMPTLEALCPSLCPCPDLLAKGAKERERGKEIIQTVNSCF